MKTGTQIINSIEYVYENRPYWDSVKKRGTHKRSYIGKNVDGVFIPNKKYKLQQELIDGFDVIERFQQPGKHQHLGEITKKQKNDLCCYEHPSSVIAIK